MIETIQTITDWHTNTFPDATLQGQLEKFEEEKKEFAEEQNVYELADMFIVACGVSRFNQTEAIKCFYYVFQQYKKFLALHADVLQEALNKKMKENRSRVWKKTGEGAFHHIGE